MSDVLALLDRLGVTTVTHAHPPVYTVEEARAHSAGIAGAATKNLFLKDESRRFWLIVMPADMALDLKTLRTRIGSKRLRFASPEELMAHLGVTPGSVSPLALVNDRAGAVTPVVDTALMATERLAFHPLDNARTTEITPEGLRTFLSQTGHAPLVVALG
jgi:Ala-tRNA(Pro) deacylase